MGVASVAGIERKRNPGPSTPQALLSRISLRLLARRGRNGEAYLRRDRRITLR
jgi:hypothetical protein